MCVRIWVIFGLMVIIPALALAERVDSLRTSFTGVNTIEVDGVYCDISIFGDSGESVTLDAELENNGMVIWPFNNRLCYKKDGEILKVWVENGSILSFLPGMKGIIRINAPKSCIISAGSYSGNIQARGIKASRLSLESKSGNVTLNNVESAVLTKTISGNILLKNVAGRLDMQSVSGDIQGYTVDLQSDSRFESISGNIYMGLTNHSEPYGYNLRSVSGQLCAGGSIVKGELMSLGGKVQIVGRTVSGEQIYE